MRVIAFAASTALALSFALGTPDEAAAEDGYQTPPANVTDIVTRAPSPRVSVSPVKDVMLLMEREALPPVAELAKPMEKLAGLRLDASINDRHGPRAYVGLSLQDVASGKVRTVSLPANADVADFGWSIDGSKIVFTNTRADAMDLHVLDTSTNTVSTVMTGGVNPIFQSASWMADDRLLVLTIPEGRGAKPEKSLTPMGPPLAS
ncbi:MAG: hypothetical protein AAFO28_08830 [Pseudomonadota bacterium]